MKNYNRILLLSACLYLVLALALGWSIYHLEDTKEQEYRVEINRITQLVNNGMEIDDLVMDDYAHIQEIAWLAIEDIHEDSAFFEAHSNKEIQIEPIYYNGELAGFLRFAYVHDALDTTTLLVMSEGMLALMALVLFGVLLYLKKQVLMPFAQVKDLPMQLAKGHFKGIVKAEKGKYAHEFLWGIAQLKDSLETSQKRQLELEKEKKQLLLSLSHDIKTPLNTIQLYARGLEEHLFADEEQRYHAAVSIQEKSKEIEGYVEDIMKHSRQDLLDIQVVQGEFYLKDLLDKVMRAYQEPLRLRHMEFQILPYDNLLLKGDLERCFEVMENIIENALKYGDGRRLEITFYEEDYCYLLRIFNSGKTVSDNELHHLFESFYRAGNSEGKQGNGLGLYICKEIMRRMDGEIFAQKEPDGMAFIMVFPQG